MAEHDSKCVMADVDGNLSRVCGQWMLHVSRPNPWSAVFSISGDVAGY